MVNFGVFFCHLKETENIENPNADINPNNNPPIEPGFLFPSAIIIIPDAATIIEIHTLIDIFSFKNKKPSNAVIKGIAAKHKRVTEADVLVIDQINDIIANAKPNPPITPDNPILK